MRHLSSALLILFCGLLCSFASLQAQSSLSGVLEDADGTAVSFATIALYSSQDSSLVKAETSKDDGSFELQSVPAGTYYLLARFLGMADLKIPDISLNVNEGKDLGKLTMSSGAFELEEAVVVTKRNLLEVKPDRTVFNVEGTINAVGGNGMDLLRKAPGVVIDNNDNISVQSRSGVLVYVDGKRLPLSGDELSAYLRSLTAEQIDRIDIITNPGAKYEAEGNAGILDIRLKRNKNHGTNGSVSVSHSIGQDPRSNINIALNYRNEKFSTFGNIGLADGGYTQRMYFQNTQFGNYMAQDVYTNEQRTNGNFRWGADYFIDKKQTIGFIVSGNKGDMDQLNTDRTTIGQADQISVIDSILSAEHSSIVETNNYTANLNYVRNGEKSTLNIDADWGSFSKDADNEQPNEYLDPDTEEVVFVANKAFETPVDIDIYSFKIDYEVPVAGGQLGLGTKLSKVVTDNTFLFYDVDQGLRAQNDFRSNRFKYDENVYAGYLNYSRKINDKWSSSFGLRVERTDATGDLQAFLEELQEPPVELEYTSFFPSAGLTYQAAPMHAFNWSYGRRINRPDYNVLNPFRAQISELSFIKGNPFLAPEIVNNISLSYTYAYAFNFSLSYSKTDDKITRLLGPDDLDPRATFLSWDNLATETVISFNASVPFDITKNWSSYINFNLARKDNQASYDDGSIIDLQAWEYNIYTQQSYRLPKGFTAEISGWYSGPGIWGGVFEFDPSFSLDLGLQKKFFSEQLVAKLSLTDIFQEAYWSGASQFAGLTSVGEGHWDSNRLTLNLSYSFGNRNVKSRKRSTGLESETKRLNSDGN